ncbi:MAG TPA: DUF302 domain-containing protein [Symbiobacteriaceae bacterium]|jgi:uncharacterized protein (DUF302 family)|nr:DUF302 domain-containing protein [Symbiobacteriaceae bacterium]
MTQVEYHYTRSTGKTVPEAIAALEAALTTRKFSALWHLDMQSKLKEKGLDLKPEFHIFEVCSAPRAKEALETNIEVGYFLPCKMVVFSDEGQTQIGLLRPNLLMEMLGEERLKALATDVEDALRAALDEAVG